MQVLCLSSYVYAYANGCIALYMNNIKIIIP